VPSYSFLVIDGSSVLVRAYFATSHGGRLRRSATGLYTNAVFGFLNMLISAVDQFAPSHLFVAWDVSRDTFRRQLFPAYKATRGELPAELTSQFQTTQQLLSRLGIRQHRDDRFEADDIIGTIATQAAARDLSVLILTGDQDALQLVDARVTVAIMRRGTTQLELYTPETLYERLGLRAHQMADLKGLMGDTSDNIPGVPGIGIKTGIKLLQAYGTLENVLAHTEELGTRWHERIQQHREMALLSKRLATIVRDVPGLPKPEDCTLHLRLADAVDALNELDLVRFIDPLRRIAQVM
jgi:5'-3' exonuclease